MITLTQVTLGIAWTYSSQADRTTFFSQVFDGLIWVLVLYSHRSGQLQVLNLTHRVLNRKSIVYSLSQSIQVDQDILQLILELPLMLFQIRHYCLNLQVCWHLRSVHIPGSIHYLFYLSEVMGLLNLSIKLISQFIINFDSNYSDQIQKETYSNQLENLKNNTVYGQLNFVSDSSMRFRWQQHDFSAIITRKSYEICDHKQVKANGLLKFKISYALEFEYQANVANNEAEYSCQPE